MNSYEKNIKKADLINIIHDYIHNTCFEEVVVTKASNIDLITIGINITTYFNALFSEEDQIDYVIIENQISPIANRMKTIQGMIAQYFIMSDVSVEHIEFVSSINKLKDLPAAYFEIKPQRSVDIGEFKGAIIPKDTPKKARDVLEKNGITEIYEYSTPDERKALFQKYGKEMFSVAPAIPAAATQEENK